VEVNITNKGGTHEQQSGNITETQPIETLWYGKGINNHYGGGKQKPVHS
jgi:hypothetical protein